MASAIIYCWNWLKLEDQEKWDIHMGLATYGAKVYEDYLKINILCMNIIFKLTISKNYFKIDFSKKFIDMGKRVKFRKITYIMTLWNYRSKIGKYQKMWKILKNIRKCQKYQKILKDVKNVRK